MTAWWGQTPVGVWRVDRARGFRAGAEPGCDFAVEGAAQDVVAAGARAIATPVRIDEVRFEVEPLENVVPWEPPRRTAPLLAAGLLASSVLHAGLAWACHRADLRPEPIDPATRITASQLATLRAFTARAEERERERESEREAELERERALQPPPATAVSAPALGPADNPEPLDLNTYRGLKEFLPPSEGKVFERPTPSSSPEALDQARAVLALLAAGVAAGSLPVLPGDLPERNTSPSVSRGAMSMSGKLPVDAVERIVRLNYGRFRFCYANALRLDPAAAGRVEVRYVIDSSGSVTTVSTHGERLRDAVFLGCVARGFQNLSFPAPESGVVSVRYVLVFAPAPQ